MRSSKERLYKMGSLNSIDFAKSYTRIVRVAKHVSGWDTVPYCTLCVYCSSDFECNSPVLCGVLRVFEVLPVANLLELIFDAVRWLKCTWYGCEVPGTFPRPPRVLKGTMRLYLSKDMSVRVSTCIGYDFDVLVQVVALIRRVCSYVSS
jgi:hypothetical protein